LSYKSATVDAIGIKGQDNTNANRSLYRNSDIVNPTATFDIAEWTTYNTDYCQGLGMLSLNDILNQNAQFEIYPNPVGNQLNISGDLRKVKSLQIYDMTGKLVKDISNSLKNEYNSIDVSQLIPNTYILRIDGKSIKFIKK